VTNTLYRQGTRENLKGDYVLFVHPAKGYNSEGCEPKLQQFLKICLKYNPVNIGSEADLKKPGVPRTFEEKVESVMNTGAAAAVFDNLDSLKKALKEVKEADLGISTIITGLIDEVDQVCREAGITRHSVEHHLGFHGNTRRLAPQRVLEINSMCGHGCVSFKLVSKMIEQVKLGLITPKKAAQLLAKPCTCGVFNPARAEILLEEAREKGEN